LDDRVVISSLIAEQFGVAVGDKIRLYSTRNFEAVMDAYKSTENPPIRLRYEADWKAFAASIRGERAWEFVSAHDLAVQETVLRASGMRIED
jgi:lipoprotein-releasing system permease protein